MNLSFIIFINSMTASCIGRIRLRVLCLLVAASFLLLSVVSVAQFIPLGNLPPVADAGGPYTGTEGVPVTLDGSGSYDPDPGGVGVGGGGWVVAWDWDLDGDGVWETHMWSPTLTYTFPVGTHTISLWVADEHGAVGVHDTTTVTITKAEGIPESPLALPVLTSLVAALYLTLRKRIGKNLE